MTKLLRLLAAPLVAAVTLLAAVASPAHADEPPSDADLARQWQEAWDTHKFYLNIPPAPGSGKSRAHRSISIDINAPIGRVFDAYSDFTNHIGRAARALLAWSMAMSARRSRSGILLSLGQADDRPKKAPTWIYLPCSSIGVVTP